MARSIGASRPDSLHESEECDDTVEKTRALRSNFEPGSPREAVRRAQWKALGLTDEDMLKPKIAVVNSSSELAICFSHLDGIARVVKEAVREAGGLPFEIRTAAPSDFIISAGAGGGYMLASRDLIVNDMEIAVEGAQLDGMICLSSCDKTPPAHLMAAGASTSRRSWSSAGTSRADTTRGSTSTSRTSSSAPCRRCSASCRRRRSPACATTPSRAGRLRGHGHRQLDAHRLRGARHDAARQRAGARQQPEDVRSRPALRPPHRGDGVGGPEAATTS